MKNLYLFLTLTFLICSAFVNDQYKKAMQEQIAKLYASTDGEELQQIANTFDRIAQAEKDQWHPHYYASYAYIQMTHMEESGIVQDQLLDKALAAVENGLKIESNNSELLTLQGYIHMLRIPIDPANRGQQYSGLSFTALQKAVALDPSNPRAILILSRMEMGTAQFFGQGITEACETLKKSIDLFQSAEGKEGLDPSWGNELAQYSLQLCKEN